MKSSLRRPREKFGTVRTGPAEIDGHLQWVRGCHCIIEGKHVCQGKILAAHVRHETDGSKGKKPSDWWANPMCYGAHEEQHRIGEPAFERKYAINLKASAMKHWHDDQYHRLKWERENEKRP